MSPPSTPKLASFTGASDANSEALAGDLPSLPGYRVLHEIARGGMGRVLAAVDLTLERDVALKILLPGANADRFVRESKITAQLPHPGIPPVHAMGTLSDGSRFLAMKLIQGQTLAAELKTADRRRLMQVFVQVCEAIGFAHSRNVIHRDLKPANVMVGAFGEVQVMDWGLAKNLSSPVAPDKSPSPVEAPVSLAGSDAEQTTDYKAADASTIEQTQAGMVLERRCTCRRRSLGARRRPRRPTSMDWVPILYALLTGRPPYSGKSAADALKNVMTTDPAPITATNPSTPPALVAICRKAMATRSRVALCDG